jgi:hypothetical protein
MSGLILYIRSSFSTLDSLMFLYSVLVRSKLLYAPVAWTSIELTHSSARFINVGFDSLYYYYYYCRYYYYYY